MISQDRFEHDAIIHEYNSIPQPIIRLVYTSLIACACVFLSWLVRYALSRLLSLLQNSIDLKILAMVCHFYPGLDWNRLGLKGDPSTYHLGKGLQV